MKRKAEEIMTASIVYHYMLQVTPELAERFLAIQKSEVDISCTISLEEVVRKYRKSKKVVQGKEQEMGAGLIMGGKVKKN